MTQTLYEQRADVWQKLASSGFPNLAEMSKRFARCSDMDRALGFQNAVSKWHNQNRLPSSTAENLARGFMNAATPAATMDKASPVLLVACATASIAKVQRVLALMGCEVIEI